MFNQLNQLKKLKELRDSLEKEKTEVEKEGVKIIVNGKLEVEFVQLNPELQKEEQEKIVRECINEAIKKVQIIAAQKMSQMTGLNL
ncbi:YbaB/EbfC family nucleoid-associated protein [Patescibacteria group bacterium]